MKLLIYDDNPDFGGHQVMACHGVEALAEDPSIEPLFMLNPANRRLKERLHQIQQQTQNLQQLDAPCTTQKFQGLLNRFSTKGVQQLIPLFESLKIDHLLCIQGEIEDSSQALLAARNMGLPSTSYIPVPHTMAYMGAKLGALRDRINQYLFALPNRYITISESMKKLLIERSVTQPIQVVLNGIPAVPSVTPPPLFVSEKTVLGTIGRIEFNQKQQHFLVNTFCAFPEHFSNCHLLLAGGGPDETHLQQLIATCSRRDDITLIPWLENAESFYASLDVLLLPSRFEGVPLVMLEALARGIPVLGSARDGMKDLLPPEWTFPTENAAALADTFHRNRNHTSEKVNALQHQIQNQLSLSAFKKAFHQAVTTPMDAP